ncbi:hypothetical protein XA68_14807 [Ophiocordyceps unilateralis]|uniref:Uncharacterized protein n=1 Tax=Ophiocordyceps unilateralis TaxID=268505 RepID=A0A2A9P9R7_OPHUN|nr:hypothetical protein XA68_14807 [Ophiocordyceps unilateralis]
MNVPALPDCIAADNGLSIVLHRQPTDSDEAPRNWSWKWKLICFLLVASLTNAATVPMSEAFEKEGKAVSLLTLGIVAL